MNCCISFVIPAKNETKNIERCLSSIEMQKFYDCDYEVIVVDNGSTDNTVSISEKYGAKVFVREDLSIAGLRNYGASVSKGNFLAFIDADMELCANWVFHVMAGFEDQSIGAVGASPRIPDNPTWVEKGWYCQLLARPKRFIRPWIASMNMVVRKDMFFEIGGFNEELPTCEDVDFGYRLSKKYKILDDQSICAVHHGGVKSIKQLIKKEIWRGSSSMRGVMSHGIVFHEIPSLLFPIMFIFFIFLSVVCFFLNKYLSISFLLLSFLPPTGKTVKIILFSKKFKYTLYVFTVWLFYYYARTISFLKEFRGVLRF